MKRLPQSGRRIAQGQSWLWTMALLCVSLLFCASTAQACHAHDALLRSTDGKAQLCAPVEDCPLCAAPHVAMAAETQTTVAQTPQMETVPIAPSVVPRKAAWPFDLFSRPPPASLRTAGIMTAGSDKAQ